MKGEGRGWAAGGSKPASPSCAQFEGGLRRCYTKYERTQSTRFPLRAVHPFWVRDPGKERHHGHARGTLARHRQLRCQT